MGNGKNGVGEIAGSIDKGRVVIQIDGVKYFRHRLVYQWHHGHCPKYLDHRDGNKLNDRIDNLRPATQSQNSMNKKVRADSAAGIKGVRLERSTGKWIARIQDGKKRKLLGRFATMEEAHEAYKSAAQKLYGEFARFSFTI
jgi:ribosomal protein L16/L10AE